MLRQFLSHSAIYTFGALLSRGISFFLLPLYTYILLPTDVALIDYVTVIGAFIAVTVALEIAQGLSRYVPEVLDDRTEVRRLTSTAFWYTILAHVVLITGVAVFSTPLARLLFDQNPEALSPVLIWAAVSFLTHGLVGFLRSQLRAELRPKASTSVAIVHAASVMVFTAAMLTGSDHPDAMTAIQALVFGGILAVVVGLYLCRSSLGFQFSAPALSKLLGFSAPLVLSSTGVIAAQFLDRIVIVEQLGLEVLAPYAVAARIALMVSLLMVGFQNALIPLVYSRLQDPDTPEQIARLLRWFLGLVLIGISGLMLADQWIIDLITPDGYGEAAQLMPVLVLATVTASAVVFFPGLSIARKTGLIAAINLAAAALNLGLNLVLIPVWGLMGAALATLCAAIFALGGMVFFSQRHFPVPIVKTDGLIAITLGLAGSFSAHLLAGNPTQTLLFGLMAIVLNVVIVGLTGLIRLDEMKQLSARLLRSRAQNT